jgi:hypothetical protein
MSIEAIGDMIKADGRYIWWLYDAPPMRYRSILFGTRRRIFGTVSGFLIAEVSFAVVVQHDWLVSILCGICAVLALYAVIAQKAHNKWVKIHPQDAYQAER